MLSASLENRPLTADGSLRGASFQESVLLVASAPRLILRSWSSFAGENHLARTGPLSSTWSHCLRPARREINKVGYQKNERNNQARTCNPGSPDQRLEGHRISLRAMD